MLFFKEPKGKFPNALISVRIQWKHVSILPSAVWSSFQKIVFLVTQKKRTFRKKWIQNIQGVVLRTETSH